MPRQRTASMALCTLRMPRTVLLFCLTLFLPALAPALAAQATSPPKAAPRAAPDDTVTSKASPATVIQAKKNFRLANFLTQNGQPEAACKVLRRTTVPPQFQAYSLYLLSHCLSGQHKTDAAIKAMEGAVRLMPQAPTARTELAALYLSQGKRQPARTQLVAAAKHDTDPTSQKSLQYLVEKLGANTTAALATAPEEKPWSVEMFAGLIYDTNINGGPNSDLIPGVIGSTPVTFKLNSDALPKTAWGATESLAASYTQQLNSKWSLLYQGGLTRTDYFDEGAYRNDSTSLATALIYHEQDYSVSIQPSVRYVRQADQLQEADTGITLQGTRMLGKKWNITGSLSYIDERVEPDRSRDAHAYSATVGINTLLAHNLKVGAKYTYLREDADDNIYSRHMNGPSVYAVWKPRNDLTLIANYRYQHSTYDKAMAYFPDARNDDQSVAGLTALWDISRFTGHDMAVRMQYVYVDNPSNIGTYDYDRQMLITGLQVSF